MGSIQEDSSSSSDESSRFVSHSYIVTFSREVKSVDGYCVCVCVCMHELTCLS